MGQSKKRVVPNNAPPAVSAPPEGAGLLDANDGNAVPEEGDAQPAEAGSSTTQPATPRPPPVLPPLMCESIQNSHVASPTPGGSQPWSLNHSPLPPLNMFRSGGSPSSSCSLRRPPPVPGAGVHTDGGAKPRLAPVASRWPE